jgi:hypothetical protein
MEDVGIVYGHFVYFMAKLYSFGRLVHFEVIWYIISHFGMFYREKSGNPECVDSAVAQFNSEVKTKRRVATAAVLPRSELKQWLFH